MNEQLEGELHRRGHSVGAGSRPDEIGIDNYNKAEVQGWKRDNEELQMRYEMLSGEKKLLEEKEKELKERVGELERRQGPLESEITRLASALARNQGGCGTQEILKTQTTVYKEDFEQDAKKIIKKLTELASNDKYGITENGMPVRHETYDEQYETLKTQITVYKEDFEWERHDCENIHEEKEKLKRELEDSKEIIKKLTVGLTSNDKYGITENGMPVRPEEGHFTE